MLESERVGVALVVVGELCQQRMALPRKLILP
jgi:hypothetical protein